MSQRILQVFLEAFQPEDAFQMDQTVIFVYDLTNQDSESDGATYMLSLSNLRMQMKKEEVRWHEDRPRPR